MFNIKRSSRFKLALYGVALLFTSNIQAQWIEATGSAEVRRGGKAQARNLAVQNALKDALLFAGASVSSIAQVSDGLLTQDQFKVSSHGSIRELELVDELHQGNMVSVTIRADIIPGEQQQCFNADFKKSLAITQLSIGNREQAKIGRLYEIGKSASMRLFNLLHKDSPSVIARPWYQQKINNRTSFEQYYDADLKVIDTIGASSESQYVMLGQISDLSFGEQTSSSLMFWQDKATERFFVVDIMLFNSSTKELIYREQFDAVADWTFNLRKSVDINGRRFWESDYGAAIDQLISRIKSAIEDAIYCQPLQGKIMKVDDTVLQFNLGLENGVEKGQVFNIIQQSHFINENGKHLPRFVISPYQVQVTDVYQKSAVAKSVGDVLLGNIQTTDHVILHQAEESSLLDDL